MSFTVLLEFKPEQCIKFFLLWKFYNMLSFALDDFINFAVIIARVASCFGNNRLSLSGLSGGRRWRERWTGFAGLTVITHVSTAGLSLDGAGNPPPGSCWASTTFPHTRLSVAWPFRGTMARYGSTEQANMTEGRYFERSVCLFAFERN